MNKTNEEILQQINGNLAILMVAVSQLLPQHSVMRDQLLTDSHNLTHDLKVEESEQFVGKSMGLGHPDQTR